MSRTAIAAGIIGATALLLACGSHVATPTPPPLISSTAPPASVVNDAGAAAAEPAPAAIETDEDLARDAAIAQAMANNANAIAALANAEAADAEMMLAVATATDELSAATTDADRAAASARLLAARRATDARDVDVAVAKLDVERTKHALDIKIAQRCHDNPHAAGC